MSAFSKPITFVRGKVQRITARPILPPGHYRSIPRSVDSPLSDPTVKRPYSYEKPTIQNTPPIHDQPFTEPETPATLEPLSRL